MGGSESGNTWVSVGRLCPLHTFSLFLKWNSGQWLCLVLLFHTMYCVFVSLLLLAYSYPLSEFQFYFCSRHSSQLILSQGLYPSLLFLCCSAFCLVIVKVLHHPCVFIYMLSHAFLSFERMPMYWTSTKGQDSRNQWFQLFLKQLRLWCGVRGDSWDWVQRMCSFLNYTNQYKTCTGLSFLVFKWQTLLWLQMFRGAILKLCNSSDFVIEKNVL